MKIYTVSNGHTTWASYRKRKDAEYMKKHLNSSYHNGYKVVVEEVAWNSEEWRNAK